MNETGVNSKKENLYCKIGHGIRNAGIFVSLFMMFYCLTHELWEEWQVPKDRYYLSGIIWALIALFFFRRGIYKKIEVWATLSAGLVLVFLWIKFKGINPDNYGEIYSKVLIEQRIIWVLFMALCVDLIRGRSIVVFLKKHYIRLLVFNALIILISVFDKRNIYPMLFPLEMFVLTEFCEDDKRSFTDYFAAAFLSANYIIVMKSFWLFPGRMEGLRYRGGFISVENFGTFCGLGVICGIYVLIRTMRSESKKWYYFLIPASCLVLPLYSLIISESRVSMAGVLAAVSVFWIISTKRKEIKIVVKRIIILALAVMVLLMLMPVIGKMANVGKEWEHGAYFFEHLSRLDPDNGRWDGYFGEQNILNALDAFSSGRLMIAAEASKQIGFKGHKYEITDTFKYPSPHNFFIQKLIEFGWIPGILYISWIIAGVILLIKGCFKKEKWAILPLLWSVYSIVVLSGTILTLHSIAATGLFLFLSLAFFGTLKSFESE